ncbi:siderophore-iron reductase FhuF [Pantoea sp. 1.19]|uniref:siderophore-iron reductase FhuF n=1 Tax=Pantoea sp. 1.19 TaxID=1925589 RepID=UPI000948B2A9|nr:siderophore-iron reductase FhuF [Pantoea sp. 1.19]
MTMVPSAFVRPPQPLIIALQAPVPTLAERLRDTFRTHRDYFLDMVKLDQTAPAAALSLAEWSDDASFQTLSDRYGDSLYADYPDRPRELKPLHSLWSQWYFGLIVPPLMMALLVEEDAICCDPAHFRVEFHASGRPARFWVQVETDSDARSLGDGERLERLILRHLLPVTQAIAARAALNARLIWNNTGYLMHWFLQELTPQIGEARRARLEHRLFFSRTLSDGQENPLYRTLLPREGQLKRRTCCQRDRLPGVQRCSDCTQCDR